MLCFAWLQKNSWDVLKQVLCYQLGVSDKCLKNKIRAYGLGRQRKASRQAGRQAGIRGKKTKAKHSSRCLYLRIWEAEAEILL